MNVFLNDERGFTDVIKHLEIRRLSWIFQGALIRKRRQIGFDYQRIHKARNEDGF